MLTMLKIARMMRATRDHGIRTGGAPFTIISAPYAYGGWNGLWHATNTVYGIDAALRLARIAQSTSMVDVMPRWPEQHV